MNLTRKRFLISLLLILAIVLFWSFFQIKSIRKNTVDFTVPVIKKYPLLIKSSNELDLDVSSAFSFYFNKDGASVLYKKREEDVFPIASISKLMTALVVLENYNLEEKINISEKELFSKTAFRDFRAWKETKIKDILSQMLVESNNSGAFALALISNRFLEAEGNSVENFVKEMNNKTKEIGLKKTSFINPSGLDGREKYNASTTKEIALLARYIIENKKELFDITTLPQYKLYSPDRSTYYEAISTNEFLHSQKNEWQKKIVGGKTGFTYAANGCLLIVLESPQKEGYIVSVVLGAKDRFLEMEKLINYIYKNYQF